MTIPLPPLPPATFPRNVGTDSWTAAEVRAIQREAMRAALDAALKAGPPFEVYCGDDAWTIGNDHACKAWEEAICALEIGT